MILAKDRSLQQFCPLIRFARVSLMRNFSICPLFFDVLLLRYLIMILALEICCFFCLFLYFYFMIPLYHIDFRQKRLGEQRDLRMPISNRLLILDANFQPLSIRNGCRRQLGISFRFFQKSISYNIMCTATYINFITIIIIIIIIFFF